MCKNGHFRLPWLRLIGLLISCLGFCANSLRAQHIVVLQRPGFNNEEVCGFDIRNGLWLCAEDISPTDSCIWEVPGDVGTFSDPILTYGNTCGDTILLRFSAAPKTGEVVLKLKSRGDEVYGKLKLTQIEKASPVTDITWTPPICENVEVEFKAETNRIDYDPGTLYLRWTALWPGAESGDDKYYNFPVNTQEDLIWAYTPRIKDYKDGQVEVTPYTCNDPNSRHGTSAASKPLTPFVVRGLYKDEHIKLLAEIQGNVPDGQDRWKDNSDGNPDKKICRDYTEVSPEWWRANGTEGYIYLGFGDYQEYMDSLAAGTANLLPEYYYTYEWTYDEAELELATSRMDNYTSLKGYGFGPKNKSRVAFRVLEGHPGDNEYEVTLTIRCDSCIQRGGLPEDFTYTDKIKMFRLDSISDFEDPAHPITYELEPSDDMVCAGKETTLLIYMPDDASKTNYDAYSNAEYFAISPKNKYNQSINPPWKELSSNNPPGYYKFQTSRTSWNSPGDTVYVEVYPANACFWNLGKDRGKNTKKFKVFVKNPPTTPILYDPITNHKVAPQYTEDMWSQLVENNMAEGEQEEPERFFLCNYTEIYASSLTATHTYGLLVKGDTLFNPDGGSTFRLVDYSDGKLFTSAEVNDYKIRVATTFEPRSILDLTSGKARKDSSWINFRVEQDARTYLEGNRDARIGFYAYNGCGAGDTGIYSIKIIDTLRTVDIREVDLRCWDTICEGMELDLMSNSNSSYFKPDDIGEDIERRKEVVTDRVDYDWKLPDDWLIRDKFEGDNKEIIATAGPSSGLVQLRIGNRCGYGTYLDSTVFVHPFVRCQIIGDTTPCRGSEVGYRFVKPKQQILPGDTISYVIRYPKTWSYVQNSLSGMAVEDDTIGIRLNVDDLADRPISIYGTRTKLSGLKSKAGIFGCNFKIVGDDTLPQHLDTLVINVKPWTSKPILVSQPDTVCADNLYTFSVKKGADVDDSVFFRWFLPDGLGWTEVNHTKDYDTADIMTSLLKGDHTRAIVRVASSRYDCDATNKGDTLDISVWFTDTITVKGDFYDAHPDNTYTKDNKKRLANPAPCEGDTVYYTLRWTQQDKETYYAAFDIQSLYGPGVSAGTAALADGDGDGESDGDGEPSADWAFLEASGWQMLSKAPYHDTVKMVVGREPILLRAAMVAHCDTSSFKQDTIRPISKVIARGEITAVRPDDFLCEYEAVDFLFDTVQHATHYVFHYPWDVQTDTVRVADSVADRAAGRLTEDYQYKIHFADTFAYNKGVIYLEAYNKCGVRPQNDTLKITSVFKRPAVPVLARVDFDAFIYQPYHVIGADTVLDTICLRKPVALEAAPTPKDDAATVAVSRFHYAWSLTQADESVTEFKAYEAGSGLNASDSLWTVTKVASPTKVNYIWLTSRHETCQRYGDTLTIALRNIDTTALQGDDRIWNYLYDKESKSDSKRIQTKPCATTSENVAYYLDLKKLDITGESYYFRWRKDSTQAYANVCDGDMKLAGGGFILQELPEDGDWTKLDTLKMTLPSTADTLEIQVVVVNRCGEEAQMPGLRIQTSDAITEADKYAVVMVSEYICDREKLTFKVVSLNTPEDAGEDAEAEKTDGIDKAGQYIWYTPWRENPDTTDVFTKSYDALAYEEGSVYVVPNNGCGDGHESEALVILADEILRPPLRVQPVPSLDFASGYDPAGGVLIETLKDSLCLRSDLEMAVKAMLSPSVDAPEADADGGALPRRDSLSYAWTTVYGVADSLKIHEDDSTKAAVNIPDFADSAYIIYVAARRKVCQRYGDSLRIELFPMDTLRFIEDLVEDSLPYDKFVVLTRGVIRDTRPTPAVDTLAAPPCVGSAHTYTIIPDFHWSLLPVSDEHPENTPTFSWNGGQTGANATTNILDYTVGWVTDNAALLPAVLSIGKTGEADDVLNLSVHARNLCGASVSKPMAVRPQALIDVAEQPVFKPLAALCEDDTIRVEVEPVEAATGYIWQTSFRSRPDTTDVPEIRYPDFRFADATITVYGFNACGDGARSETLDLKPLLRIPQRPEAQWFNGLQMVGDTVYDTLCLHGNNLLWVKAAFNDEADDDVFYDWQLLPDYTEFANLTALPGQPLANGPDSIYVTPINGEMSVGDDLYLMVAARRASCRYWSDTLYIALHMTDTVSVSSLGRLIWYKADAAESDRTEEAPTLPLCPGSEVRIGVENETAAPAYRWQFPDPTWRFADDVTDTTAAVVKVVVGETEGVIRVSPMTDPDNRRCAYSAPNHTLTSTTITLVPALPARVFDAGFNETPCAGTEVTYAVQPPATDELPEIARYRWEFPKGWRVFDAAGNLTESNLLEPESLTCRVLPDSSSGMVKAYVLSKCGNEPNRFSVSKPVEKAVHPMDTARLEIIADATVCKDSTLQMDIKALNEWTFGTGYDLQVTYIGSDAAVVNPENPLTFDFPNAPDSSLVMVGWFSGDSTRLTFTPRHTGGCHVLPAIYALKADTVPTIEGIITGAERICMGAEGRFEAAATNLEDGVEVTYHWEVPEDEGWEIVLGADSSVAVIKAGWYADVDEVEKVIRCYPRALCGTALPFEYTLKVNPPAPFNGTLQATYSGDATPLTPTDRPCIGSDLSFDLTHPDAPAAVRYVWETPEGWTRRLVMGTLADSLLHAEYTASKAGMDTVRVRFLELNNPLSCGLSAPVGYAVAVRDSAPKATLTRLPYPCKTHTEIAFIVAANEEIDSVHWTVPDVYDAAKAITTDAGSAIFYNRLTLTDPAGFPNHFPLMLRTFNVCGTRDTSMTVRPVDSIPDFADNNIVKVSHYCPGDSAYAYVEIPVIYTEKGTSYHWQTDEVLTPLQDSLIHENDDLAGIETVAWMQFAGGEMPTDTGKIGFYAQNDCNATDRVSVRTAPYTYAILAKPGDDTVVYGRSGVSLAVVSTQYGTPADYTYVWYPENRVTLSDPAAPDDPATTFATKGLYNPEEIFRVRATERVDMTRPFYFGRSACVAFDSVTIAVDSTFAMAMGALDTACMAAPFEISAKPYGGNSERYHFDWYRLVGDSVYEPIAEDDHTESLTIMADAPSIKLMVIGRDSTFVYADTETPDIPDVPEEQPTPEDPENPDLPGPDPIPEDTEQPEDNPDEPLAPPVDEDVLLYVFTKVDTQYVEIHTFDVEARFVQPGHDVRVPFGTKVKLVAEAMGGSLQYAYLWAPDELLDRHDSTMAAVSTLRLYEDCAVELMVRDTVTGCRDTLQVLISMSDEIGDIPNAFSPNGDGINDIFMNGADVIIFDRFGRELFRSTHQEGWDGTYKGKTVSPGEYLYVVTIRKNGQEYVKKGTVSVFTK